jgi:hypothetical protein
MQNAQCKSVTPNGVRRYESRCITTAQSPSEGDS